MLAIIGIGMRLIPSISDRTLVVLSLPALALFYLVGSLPLISPTFLAYEKRWKIIVPVIVAGIAFAYCVMSMLYFLLGVIAYMDLLENASIILGIQSIVAFMLNRKTSEVLFKKILIRSLVIWGAVILVVIL